MDEAIKQIGERLKGLREVLNIPAEEIAELCEISLDHYLKIESGEADPSVYRLSKISKRYGIDLDVLLFGEEPRMKGGNSSFGRAPPCQGGGGGFEPRFPLHRICALSSVGRAPDS